MDWIEKVKYLIERKYQKRLSTTNNDTFFYDVYPEENCWKPGEIDALMHDYPWLPKSYLNFIQEFDGISVAFCRFYGSKEGKGLSLEDTFTESESNPCLRAGYFPFGRDVDGSMFIFNKKGEVLWWDKYDYDFEEEPKYLASCFEEFVDQCLLGFRFGEFMTPEKSKFYPFLKSMNWT